MKKAEPKAKPAPAAGADAPLHDHTAGDDPSQGARTTGVQANALAAGKAFLRKHKRAFERLAKL